jgi:hypothetical protein
MSIDDLSMLGDDQIDYATLSDETLRELALGDDMFVANSALAILAIRHSKHAAPLAWDILTKPHGDRYLHAAALNVLFRMDRQRAVDYLIGQVQALDSYVLNTLAEIMLENHDYFKSDATMPIVRTVMQRMQQYNSDTKWPDPEVRGKFLRLYTTNQTSAIKLKEDQKGTT